MYTEFYHLKKCPFHITPDPEFLFLSPSHKQALAAIIYGVEEKKGFIAVLGEVGVGKTTILRSYLDSVDKEQTRIIYTFNPDLSFDGVLKLLSRELDIAAQSGDTFEMVEALHRKLIEEYREGRNVVFIIDEAQNMPVATLEHLRMLSNLETSTDKLIQIVLLGQPELENILNKYELRQLRQRIAIFSTILPLTETESYQYIQFRLVQALKVKAPVFTKGAVQEIVRAAKGIPRSINIIADNALITGFGDQRRPVTSKIIREVLADLRSEAKPRTRWAYVVVGALVLILAVALLAFSDNIIDDTFTTARSQLSKLEKAISVPVIPKPGQDADTLGNTGNNDGRQIAAATATDHKGEEGLLAKPEGKTDPVSKAMAMQATPVQGKAEPQPNEKDSPTSLQKEHGATFPAEPAALNPDETNESAAAVVEPKAPLPASILPPDPAESTVAHKPLTIANENMGSAPNTPSEPARLSHGTPQSANSGSNGAVEQLKPEEQPHSLNQRPQTMARTVKKGDSLIRIAADVYNISVEEVYKEGLLDSIIKLNPHIHNVNRIEIGQTLFFPLTRAPGKAKNSAG